MNLVTLENVSKQFSERVLLDQVNLLINRGDRIGLIGLNGSGKTTLLRMVAGLDIPDAGALTVWGGVRIHYLPQEPRLQPEWTVLEHIFQSEDPQLALLREYQQAVAALRQAPHDPQRQAHLLELNLEMERTHSWDAERKAKTVLTQLGITQFEQPVGTLSGGQQKRVALAHALLDPADLLILDEPTNHVDAETIAWLEGYLLTVPGALLMVTHDRYFLDRVVNRIVELDRRQLVSYPGNYSRYLELSTQRHEQLAGAEAKRQALLRRELEWLRKGVMARGTKQKARKQRIEELQQLSHDRREDRVAMALAGRRLGKRVLQARGLSKSFGELSLFQDLDFDLVPGDRIGIIGPNGAGKSTLLDILAGKVLPDQGDVSWGETVLLAYYDQQAAELPEDKRVIEVIEAEAPLIRTPDGTRVDAARMLEWFLFSRAEQRARVSSLSGGERRRLYLLRALLHQPNVILLDEPTNDLDVQTLTVLENFLDHFQGALIVVSHDRYFLDRTVDFLVAMGSGQVSGRYPAPFSNFQRIRQEQAAAQKAAQMPDAKSDGRTTTQADRQVSRVEQAEKRKPSWKEQRELEQLEADIAALEGQKETLENTLNNAGDDYLSLQALADDLARIDSELEIALSRWFGLSGG